MKICENCNVEHNGEYGSGRFCSAKCARGFSSKEKRQEINEKISNALKGKNLSEQTKQKISNSLKGKHNSFYGKKHTEETKRKIAESVKKNSCNVNKIPQSILEVSKRTITKITHRLNIGCSRCGWNESTCDIHHINGRNIENPDSHDNLTYICPNCHRLVHTHKITKEELIPLSQHIGDKWKEYYYWN